MKSNYPLKTMGRQTARLVEALYDQSQTTFGLAEVQRITGLRPVLASSLIYKAIHRGFITRLKGGLYSLVPSELGSIREYAGDPFIVGRELASGSPYFVSHASAMEIHRMVTQPRLGMFISSTKRIRNRNIQGTDYRFVFLPASSFFGTTKHWATKQQSVDISDLERTVVDGLRQPHYCGGIAEVAKGLWMRHEAMKMKTLVDYALRLGVGAVIRRLGYLLEFYSLAQEPELLRLRASLTNTYVALDPLLPRQGPHLARWGLQLNIAADELERIRTTFCRRMIYYQKKTTAFSMSNKNSSATLFRQKPDKIISMSLLPVNVPHDQIAAFCRTHHICKLSLFGSVLRTDFTSDSDIDVLVEFESERTPGYLGMVRLQRELSNILGGRRVDLRTPRELSKYFRQQVLAEAAVQYAA